MPGSHAPLAVESNRLVWTERRSTLVRAHRQPDRFRSFDDRLGAESCLPERTATEPEAVVELMSSPYELAMASLLGLGTTSSSLLGAAVGLYLPFSRRPLACLLAFAAGSLISALAIEPAFVSAQSLHHQGYNAHAAWAFVSAGFAAGAVIYYSASLFLEKKGAA